ncbi:MAG: TMEM165/GDT1 family protein [Proteocatella sp.]
MTTFLTAFLLVFLAEMGDKTQLLALAFSTKFKVKQVLAGVMIGAFLNHGIAIALASFVAGMASGVNIKIFAALLFIGFGFWSMKLEFEDDEEENEKFKFGPIITVAVAFFIGELGDKTQMTAMALGLDSASPSITLMGTTAGMVAVSSIGIIAGKLIGKKIPEVTMKFISSFVFLGFGVAGLYAAMPKSYMTPVSMAAFAMILGTLIYIILRANTINRSTYFTQKLSTALGRCRHCEIHDPKCAVGLEIEEITKMYIGSELPYLGKVVTFFESLKQASPKKYKIFENHKKN